MQTLDGAEAEWQVQQYVREQVAERRSFGPGGEQGVKRAARKLDMAEIERIDRTVDDDPGKADRSEEKSGFQQSPALKPDLDDTVPRPLSMGNPVRVLSARWMRILHHFSQGWSP